MTAAQALKLQAVAQIGLAIVQSVEEAGPLGIPGGTLYAALMSTGAIPEQFEKLMGLLGSIGRIQKNGQLYLKAED